MSHSQSELNADLQRDIAGQQERKPTSPVMWLVLLLVVLGAGAWWYAMNRDSTTSPVTDTAPVATQPTAATDAGNRAAAPSKSSAQRSSATKKPVMADRSAKLMADMPKPKYPPAALRAGTGGTVTLDVQVDPQGEPSQITIAKRSGNRELDRAALSAASNWRFEPAMHHGKAVAAAVQVPVEFSPQ